ncbi:hypothetical protein ACQE2J_06850 [Brevibacterium sp. LE-L]|uniref:hypothetical protein n=1 Tax=Brevibacterium sp. LE-L TaxID=3418557 RepID=UPI003CE8F881
MKRLAATAAITTALLAVTGCAEPTPHANEEPPATIGQFASVIARHDKPIRDVVDESSGCLLTMLLGDSDVLAQRCVDSAGEGRFEVIEIKNRFGELGEAPAELDELVQRMIHGGEHLATTEDLDVRANCVEVGSDECATSVSSVLRALEEVIVPELDA